MNARLIEEMRSEMRRQDGIASGYRMTGESSLAQAHRIAHNRLREAIRTLEGLGS